MIRITHISRTGHAEIVLDDDGRWAVLTATGPRPLTEEPNFVGLLPLLESPLADVKRRIEQAVRETGAPIDADSFPTTELVRVTLATRSASVYWKELALLWAEQLAGPGSELVPALSVLINTHDYPVSLRKKARLLRDSICEADPPDAHAYPHLQRSGQFSACCSGYPDSPCLRKLMKDFLADPSLVNARAIESGLVELADTGADERLAFDDLASQLAQYRPEGGDSLYSAAEMRPIVARALSRLEHN